MESFATAYPVIFHDGEEEHEKGHIGLHSVLSFKKFQAQMSRVVGLPANQLSTVFVCRRSLKDTDNKRQKLPINETTNFNIILNQHNPSRERDCHFLVSIKKSKKERKGSTRKRNAEAENGDDEDSASSRGDISPLDERPKKQQQEESDFPEANSPTSILQRPLSPAVSSPGEDAGMVSLQQQQETLKNNRKQADKVDRILLRRDAGAVAPGRDVPQRVEGFTVPGSAAARQSHLLEPRRSSGLVTTTTNSSSFAQTAQAHTRLQHQQQQQQQQQVARGSVSHQPQRFNDALARGYAPPASSVQPEVTSSTTTGSSWLTMLARSQQQAGAGSNSRAISVHQQPQPQQQQPLQPLQPPQQQQPLQPLQQQQHKASRCKQCSGGKRAAAEFHHCIDDAVFSGFQGRVSPAGPIQRLKPAV